MHISLSGMVQVGAGPLWTSELEKSINDIPMIQMKKHRNSIRFLAESTLSKWSLSNGGVFVQRSCMTYSIISSISFLYWGTAWTELRTSGLIFLRKFTTISASTEANLEPSNSQAPRQLVELIPVTSVVFWDGAISDGSRVTEEVSSSKKVWIRCKPFESVKASTALAYSFSPNPNSTICLIHLSDWKLQPESHYWRILHTLTMNQHIWGLRHINDYTQYAHRRFSKLKLESH